MSVFGQINLLVRDMAASVEFYRLLEVDIDEPFEWPAGSGAHHIGPVSGDDDCFMAFDDHPMARIWNHQFEPGRAGGNVVIGLMVDSPADVDRLYEAVEAAGYGVGQKPYDAFFGSRYAIVIDPDGNQVGLKSPIEEDRRYVPDVPSSDDS